MPANRERGEFTLTVKGVRYTLRLTTNACAELEDISNGRTWDQVMAGINRGSVKDTRLLMWACLREHHPEIATNDPTSVFGIGKFIDDAGGLVGVLQQLQTFIRMNGETADGEDAGAQPGDPPEARDDAEDLVGASSTSTRSRSE